MEAMGPCVLIPAFNEEKHIGEVVHGASRYVRKIIVVDDGSTDGTAERARSAGAEVLRHGENRGKGAALKSGMTTAYGRGFDPVVILDADAQHDWNQIPLFLDAARRSGADIIVGNRMGGAEGMPLVRYLTNRFTSFFAGRLAGQPIPDSQCGYRLVREKAFRSLSFSTERFDTETEMLIEAGRAGCMIDSVPVRTIYGAERSKIHPLVDTFRFFRVVFRYLLKPGRGKSVTCDS